MKKSKNQLSIENILKKFNLYYYFKTNSLLNYFYKLKTVIKLIKNNREDFDMFIDYKDIGDRIVQKRRELGLSQKELAELLNISNNHLSNIENGKAGPSFELFILLCKELRVSSDFIIFDYIYPNPSDSLMEKIKLCTDENKIIIAKFVDFCLTEQEKSN